jgi:hypothetical protein
VAALCEGRIELPCLDWILTVAQESWVSRAHAGVAESEDGDYELRQRRALVDRWAAATQEFRDV